MLEGANDAPKARTTLPIAVSDDSMGTYPVALGRGLLEGRSYLMLSMDPDVDDMWIHVNAPSAAAKKRTTDGAWTHYEVEQGSFSEGLATALRGRRRLVPPEFLVTPLLVAHEGVDAPFSRYEAWQVVEVDPATVPERRVRARAPEEDAVPEGGIALPVLLIPMRNRTDGSIKRFAMPLGEGMTEPEWLLPTLDTHTRLVRAVGQKLEDAEYQRMFDVYPGDADEAGRLTLAFEHWEESGPGEEVRLQNPVEACGSVFISDGGRRIWFSVFDEDVLGIDTYESEVFDLEDVAEALLAPSRHRTHVRSVAAILLSFTLAQGLAPWEFRG